MQKSKIWKEIDNLHLAGGDRLIVCEEDKLNRLWKGNTGIKRSDQMFRQADRALDMCGNVVADVDKRLNKIGNVLQNNLRYKRRLENGV